MQRGVDALHILPYIVLAFIGGWFGARLEHIEVLHRVRIIEGYCKGVFAANARAAQREMAVASAQAAYLTPRLTEEQILAEAQKRGLTWGTSSRRSVEPPQQ